MKENPNDIIEDFTLVSPPEPFAWLWPAIIVAIILIIAAFIVWKLYRKRKLPFQAAEIPSDVSARESLAASRKLLDQGLHREFVIEVSRVLRIYIEDRFALRAPHLSTEEFLFEAENSERLTDQWKMSLCDFLFQCDRVKFALAHLESPRMEALYSTAEQFIDQTAHAP